MIETKRLLLREYMEVDYDDLYEFLSQPYVLLRLWRRFMKGV